MSAPVSQAIRDLKELNLTKWGQIKLSAFPDSAIQYAHRQLRLTENLRDPFRWFFKIAMDYCDKHDIRPNWERVQKLSRDHRMPYNAKLTLDAPATIQTPAFKATINQLLSDKRPESVNKKRPQPAVAVTTTRKRETTLLELQNMNESEANAKAAQMIAADPVFGAMSARGFLAGWHLSQDKPSSDD